MELLSVYSTMDGMMRDSDSIVVGEAATAPPVAVDLGDFVTDADTDPISSWWFITSLLEMVAVAVAGTSISVVVVVDVDVE